MPLSKTNFHVLVYRMSNLRKPIRIKLRTENKNKGRYKAFQKCVVTRKRHKNAK